MWHAAARGNAEMHLRLPHTTEGREGRGGVRAGPLSGVIEALQEIQPPMGISFLTLFLKLQRVSSKDLEF